MPRPIILDCTGERLTADEAALFRDLDPYGFILFARHLRDPEQVRTLIGELRESVGREAPVLIDQEGGRVARLGPPHWRKPPAAGRFAELAERDRAAACRAAWLNSRLIAEELRDLGITVDCLPVLDLRLPGAHLIIGDRAYGATPDEVIDLARAAAEGLMAGGVLPVAKHIPGHGRATADSHLELSRVDASRAELEATDFVPFRALKDLPIAMTAHVTYEAIDPDRPATLSPRVIEDVIRGHMGFKGALLSDDLTMKALKGPLPELAGQALAAGCDALLLCNADIGDRRAVLEAVSPLDDAARRHLDRHFATPPREPVEIAAVTAELAGLMGTAFA